MLNRHLPHFFAFIVMCLPLQAELWLPNIFGDHMVLQREQANRVWGKDTPGRRITVSIGEQSHRTTASRDGSWQVALDALPAGGPHTLKIEGTRSVVFKDVLIGEVWICSGQSNMEWDIERSNYAELEIVSANFPQIRLISVPKVGTQELKDNFKGSWRTCSPKSVATFSAVGYHFGRRLHTSLGVPIGLIDNAWGGSAAEAWLPRETLEANEQYAKLLTSWDAKVAAYSDEIHAAKQKEFRDWHAAGQPKPRLRPPSDPRYNQNRPANIYNGVLHPTIGYGIRGVIWYQGESNAGRAYQYRDLFPLLITTWREKWGQGDFPFYWAQLADFRNEANAPAPSRWAELREAQTMTLSLPNTGEAVIIDAGEGRDIHPRDKQTVGNRLALHALAKDYGFDIAADSPRFAAMETKGSTITLTFENVSEEGLYSFDVRNPIGFSIAGEDQRFVWANAKIVGKNKVEVSSPNVAKPVAVRYAWADNPRANLQDRNGLQVTPFRTDDWPGLTIDSTH